MPAGAGIFEVQVFGRRAPGGPPVVPAIGGFEPPGIPQIIQLFAEPLVGTGSHFRYFRSLYYVEVFQRTTSIFLKVLFLNQSVIFGC